MAPICRPDPRPDDPSRSRWWRGKDSNLRRRKPADLQSAPVGRLGTPPQNEPRIVISRWRSVNASWPGICLQDTGLALPGGCPEGLPSADAAPPASGAIAAAAPALGQRISQLPEGPRACPPRTPGTQVARQLDRAVTDAPQPADLEPHR